jgi:DNA-binding CsgD family transcriptional regulator
MQTEKVKLTVRQQEVFRLIAAGRTNAEISEEIAISRVGVKSHIGEIYLKIGIHRRADAICWWRENRGEG